ncbi:hypothetical protein HYFRA_00006410 [Hymenoscyphus fraxineus]|uniref:Uncharacterized protein n=1 Tax=Hymenoscyphus fraxineus TaxID=746836 RepID=A0A9N9KQQ8_9HELO|nr:hypothetical protein HYFRA_00006410 [Hymenoscyphus fraxineus]
MSEALSTEVASEISLAEIPTQQLVLKLLQELASRVGKLENADKAVENYIVSVPGSEKDHQTDESEFESTEATLPKSETFLEDPTAEEESQPSCCKGVCQIGGQDRAICVLVPYGSFYNGEFGEQMITKISDAFEPLKGTNREIYESLQASGIAAIPDDGRIQLVNFQNSPVITHKRIQKYGSEFQSKGGIFVVVDFDAYRDSVMYEYDAGVKVDVNYVDEVSHPFGNELLNRRTALSALRGNWRRPSFRVAKIHQDRDRNVSLAPWRRLIIIEGLSVMKKDEFLSSDAFSPFCFPRGPHPVMDSYINGQASYFNDNSNRRGFTFHFSWYNVGDSEELNLNLIKNSVWKHGFLRGGRRAGAILHQEAFTIHAIKDTAHEIWTTLLLVPPRSIVRSTIEYHSSYRGFPHAALQTNIAMFILWPMKNALEGWKSLYGYINAILGTGEDIFDLETHDKLIFDDDLFSRSRTYFWMINCLQESDNLIHLNIQTWNGYRNTVLLSELRRVEGFEQKESAKYLQIFINECDEIIKEFESLRNLLKDQREKAIALRDGLFSASAVMESRASTRLGENVKLLTYVSIFYLPLSFCTSVWSTTDTFNYNNLAITMILVGVGTYMAVFNLNNIVKTVSKQYKKIRSLVLESMRKDESPVWKSTGGVFYRYELKASPENTKPSEWWILIYQLRSFRKLLAQYMRSSWKVSVQQVRTLWESLKPKRREEVKDPLVTELETVVVG